MTMITPSYLGETIEYSSLHACRSTLEDPTSRITDSVNCETLSLRNCFGCVDKEEITSAIAGRLAQDVNYDLSSGTRGKLRFVILSEALAIAKRKQMRSRRTPYPQAQPEARKGISTASATVEERRFQRRVKRPNGIWALALGSRL